MNDVRALVVGREDGIARRWVGHLRAQGVDVVLLSDGAEAVRRLILLEPHVVLLDSLLEGALDGFDTCRAIRSQSSTIILMAAAEVGPYEEVVALAVGADHLLAAESPAEVVVARIRALLRRSRGVQQLDAEAQAVAALASGSGEQSARRHSQFVPDDGSPWLGRGERIVDGDLAIDALAREVQIGGHRVAFTRIEFDLLATLARHPRHVFSRDQLMASAWEDPFDGSHVLDAHLSRMRGKVSAAGGERVAHSVRGVGFRLRS